MFWEGIKAIVGLKPEKAIRVIGGLNEVNLVKEDERKGQRLKLYMLMFLRMPNKVWPPNASVWESPSFFLFLKILVKYKGESLIFEKLGAMAPSTSFD